MTVGKIKIHKPIPPIANAVYVRDAGVPVRIIHVGPYNAVGRTQNDKYLLFGLDGHGVGATGNLIEKYER